MTPHRARPLFSMNFPCLVFPGLAAKLMSIVNFTVEKNGESYLYASLNSWSYCTNLATWVKKMSCMTQRIRENGDSILPYSRLRYLNFQMNAEYILYRQSWSREDDSYFGDTLTFILNCPILAKLMILPSASAVLKDGEHGKHHTY